MYSSLFYHIVAKNLRKMKSRDALIIHNHVCAVSQSHLSISVQKCQSFKTGQTREFNGVLIGASTNTAQFIDP